MTFKPDLKPGQVIDNDTLCKIFKCAPMGGIRKSNTTNSLVIVSNHVESNYYDRWDGDILYYTGMGQKGDQSPTFMQNGTLAESGETGIPIFLFEVYHSNEYTYRGEVTLTARPKEARQPDRDGNDRKVLIFPLKLVSSGALLDKDTIEKSYKVKLKKARKLKDENLSKLVARGRKKPGKRQVVATHYDRNPYVVEYVKRRSGGLCEACGAAAPFKMADGTPYLEVHHITPLADGGDDTINNAAALCPNCHRRCHHAKDKKSYTKKLRKIIDSLIKKTT